jgi:hypothetical protein
MQCALKRFGPGVACTRPTNTEASKEMQTKLSQMMSEREKQDKMWLEESEPKQTESKKQTQSR